MKMGSPPTEPQALTGELTPPGIKFLADENNAADLVRSIFNPLYIFADRVTVNIN
jgi:hypothetical protein